MKNLLIAALAATSALVAAPAAAGQIVNFTIETGLSGQNVPGSPATITGQFDYDVIQTGTRVSVNDFNVAINGVDYNVFPGGVTTQLTNFNGATGDLRFFSNNDTIFAFALTGLVSANGRPPAFGATLTYATDFNYNGTPITIAAGSVGTLSAVAAAVPEPATWAMLILGFGVVGGSLRRRAARSVSTRATLSFA